MNLQESKAQCSECQGDKIDRTYDQIRDEQMMNESPKEIAEEKRRIGVTLEHHPYTQTWSLLVRRIFALALANDLVRNRTQVDQERTRVLVEALEAAGDTIHALHPPTERVPVGKGICLWKACVEIRVALKEEA